MVQRVPAHLGESTSAPVSPWIVIAGILLLIIISCGVILVLFNIPEQIRVLGTGSQPTATRTPRVVTPAVTVIPATLPPPSPTPGPTAVTTKYKVKPGDTLSSIAVKYHTTIEAIKIANGMKDDTVRAGDEIIIPLPTPTPVGGAYVSPLPVSSTPTTLAYQSPSIPSAPAGTPGVVKHTVVKGDTLISIAATYDSNVDAIRIANQLVGDMLSVGQVLQVPVGAWTPTAVPTIAALAQPTATAQFAYGSPALLSPPNNKEFRGASDIPFLEWTAPGALKPTEFYVIHLDSTVNGKKQSLPSKQVWQGTTVALTATDYPGANANGTVFSWYVVVVNSGLLSSVRADIKNSNPGQLIATSRTSEVHTFVWY